jgi:hypothetical protein
MALKEQKLETLVLSDAEAESLLARMEAAPKLSEKERLARQSQLIENASKVDFYTPDQSL